MQLTPSVVTTLYLTLSLQKVINRGRELHERRIESLHCYVGGIGTLILPTFSLVIISLCCIAWRLSSLEKRRNRTRSRFREVPSLRRRYLCTSSMINKYVILFLFQSLCNGYWIFVYDHMFMLIILGFWSKLHSMLMFLKKLKRIFSFVAFKFLLKKKEK